MSTTLVVSCSRCAHAHSFPEPYPCHAGFGDAVFLYNDAGNCTLAWGTFSAAYEAIVGKGDPWRPAREHQITLEDQLPLSPKDDQWRFEDQATEV